MKFVWKDLNISWHTFSINHRQKKYVTITVVATGSVPTVPMDDLHYRQIFGVVKKNEIPEKNLLKVNSKIKIQNEIVKFQNLVEKCCNVWKI